MKPWRVAVVVAAGLIGTEIVLCGQSVHPDGPAGNDHVRWIEGVLKEIGTLKPGMTRAALLRVVVPEGGISTRRHRRFAFRGCPYIKIDVEFAIPSTERALAEEPTDVIESLSRPFLEYPIVD